MGRQGRGLRVIGARYADACQVAEKCLSIVIQFIHNVNKVYEILSTKSGEIIKIID
jgi:hypothetical protein